MMCPRAWLPQRSLWIAIVAAAGVFLFAGAFANHHASHAQTGAGTPAGTPAQGELETVDANGTAIRCSDLPEVRGGVLLGKIIPCLTKTIQKTSSRFSREMIEWLRPLFFAFLTLVIVIYGLKLLQGEGQMQTHVIVLLIKVGFALTVLAAIPGDRATGEGGLIGISYNILNEGQAVVMGTLGPDNEAIHCDIERYQGAQTPLIWAQMDCVLGKLYGFTVGQDVNGQSRPNMLLASSIFGLLGGFFFGGSFGVALFFLCIGVLVSMFMLVIRVVMAFVNSYLFLGLYMIMAPLLLPLMFLRVTTPYFDKWLSGIIAALILPIIISAYVVIALQMYDKLLFSPNALVNNLFDNEWVQQGQQLPRQACDRQLMNDPAFRAQATGRTEAQIYGSNPLMQNFVNPLLSGANDLCGGVRLPVFDLKATPGNEKYHSARDQFTKLFMDCAKLFIMALLIDAGFKTLLSMIRPMLGSGSVVAANTGEMSTPQEMRLHGAFEQAKAGFSQPLQGRSGTDFVGQLDDAMRGGARGFFSGISRDRG